MGVAPGTVVSRCGEDNNRCDVTLVLDWRSANPALRTGVQGATTVSLVLTRQGGQMKGTGERRSAAAIELQARGPRLAPEVQLAMLGSPQRAVSRSGRRRCACSPYLPVPG